MDGMCPVRTPLLLVFLMVFCLRGDAQDENPRCFHQVKVKRNVVWRAITMQSLRISCTVTHCGVAPSVTWCKVNSLNGCVPMKESVQVEILLETSSKEDKDMISFLHFKSISKEDDGLYRCEVMSKWTSSVSHSIKVGVSDGDPQTENSDSSTNSSSAKGNMNNESELAEWLPYVYICAGIVTLVVIVMLISFLCLHGCKRPTRPRQKANRSQVQYSPTTLPPHVSPSAPIPKRERSLHLPFAPNSNNIYDTPTSVTSQLGLLTPSCSNSTANCGSSTGLCDDRRGSRSNQVVYAALDHLACRQAPGDGDAYLCQEFSEYAAIRVT